MLDDSLDCLFWIHDTKKIWKQFIQTRVLKVTDPLEGTNWLFCPRVQNPADILKRGSYLKDDDIKEFWLEGPPFLQLPQEYCLSTKKFENYKSKSHMFSRMIKFRY